MHVVMFGDQHAETLGGAQVSMRLQRRFLEKAGHTVTIVAPRMHGARARQVAGADPSYLDLPSIPITLDREYSMTWPGRRTDRWLDAALRRLIADTGRPRVDVVHVQADFWGAYIGHRFARRHGLPVVHTMHNRVDVGIEATAPFPKLVLRVLNAWQRRALGVFMEGKPVGRDGWAYLRRFAGRSDAVTAPSSHFARRLEAHGAVPGGRRMVAPHLDAPPSVPAVDVIWNGIDDDVLDEVLAEASTRAEKRGDDATRRGAASVTGASDESARLSARAPGRPRFVWLGRMSPEKRLLPFLEALAASGVDADVEIIGGGGQLRAARRLVEGLRPRATVTFAGRMPYAQTLRRIAAADAVVQTSIGFETQGMTIFEAASLGTPSVVSDPDLAAELGSGYWAVADGDAPGPGGDAPGPGGADDSVTALADALRAAASDIAVGTPRVPNPTIRERFRQSSRTAAMVAVYERVTA
ncbi:glycosyltransferase [Microbacterium sp. B35-04]|uniref:glycosyltransferase n=1 Tax=Microbacterium sp. B35-04 TaxID=1961716 RepID=UPI0013D2E17E|nr:glycosyltransferase [Microbacterium sp. B35-04]KAF2412592.1 glycosyltransferase [Microbacterium sp. B35-04]